MSLYKEKLGGEGELTPPEGGIHFKTSKAMSGVNFFDTVSDYDFSSLKVYVNDKLTNIPANALTAAAGDDIRIVSRSDPSNPYPFFRPYNKDYIASIEEPLPFMGNDEFDNYFRYCASLVSIPENLFINNPQITTFYYCFYQCTSLLSIPQGLFANNPNATHFSSCFYGCTSLTSIPQGLFANNPNAYSFYYCFYQCTSLKSIPQGLFANNPNAVDFGACFQGCTSLTSIPQGLFDNNPNATHFGSCFQGCTSLTSIPLGLFDKQPNAYMFGDCFNNCKNLTVRVQIGSTTTEWTHVGDVSDFAENTAARGTVYCRAGSNVYNAFLDDTWRNVDVLTY